MDVAYGIFILFTKEDSRMTRGVLEALSSVPEDIVDPKIRLFRSHLQSDDMCLPLDQYSSRTFFHAYLENDMTDRLLWVIGQ